uniref:GPN-loop GTPase n=1 Tax=Eptatretus burgeri TaxID=7764 RepID=A0A8C4QKE4_EPTBU
MLFIPLRVLHVEHLDGISLENVYSSMCDCCWSDVIDKCFNICFVLPPAPPPPIPNPSSSIQLLSQQRTNAFLHTKQHPPYVVNLDPAVSETPYPCNIDIRDTINYKEVMNHYGLGPNGAIVTSLNLLATRFPQVIQLIEKRKEQTDFVLIDTPGQIEVFTWSASGSIITETLVSHYVNIYILCFGRSIHLPCSLYKDSLSIYPLQASVFPTVVVFVLDTARCTSPITFTSNMLSACSILYKTKLPFILAMNKTDVVSHDFAVEWMTDFESLGDVLSAPGDAGASYASSLARSMSLTLSAFYQHLKVVGVSAMMGTGMPELFSALEEAREEYEREYRPEYERLQMLKERTEENEKERQLSRLHKDLGEVPPSFPPGPSQLILSRGAGGTELEAEDPLAVEKERWRQQHKHRGQSRDTTKATRGVAWNILHLFFLRRQ